MRKKHPKYLQDISRVTMIILALQKINMEARFQASTSLTEISVSHSPTLSLVDQGSFSELSNLKILWLHHNPSLTYISKKAFNGDKTNTTLREVSDSIK